MVKFLKRLVRLGIVHPLWNSLLHRPRLGQKDRGPGAAQGAPSPPNPRMKPPQLTTKEQPHQGLSCSRVQHNRHVILVPMDVPLA